ncbi:MAG: sensor histidine kinase [Candidatus Nanopelagicales bacterium]|jgi:two-component sensor histidine kinase|nr:sensor histidine kinase [Candidatus Nanopelagicales bacterium]
MSVRTLAEIAADRTDLDGSAVGHCEALLRDLGLLADLAFSDLILWLPVWNSGGYVAAAQVRPSTAATRYPSDLVGTFTPRGRRPELDRAWAAPGLGQLAPRTDPLLPAAGEAIGVGRGPSGPWIAALTRSAVPATRASGTLERAYLQAADDLFTMIRAGDFPYGEAGGSTGAEPRVGDGLIRLDQGGAVVFASPNASSAYRRLGLATDLVGSHLGLVSGRIARRGGSVDASVALVCGGRIPGEVELSSDTATVTVRSLPLRASGRGRGSIVLVRDVTELRRRERALLSKDATIREIHHRVKNNLQTVAALLRLQARRLGDAGAAAALAEAERRVGAIAVVHDLLAQTSAEEVPFDDVADRLIAMVRQTAAPEMGQRSIVRRGTFGTVSADRAAALSMALVELLANAVEHGAGDVELDSGGAAEGRWVTVSDEGPGFPSGFRLAESPRLGLRIVETLVTEELRGRLAMGRSDGRTQVRLDLPADG